MLFEDFRMRVAHADLKEYLWLHPGVEPARPPDDGGEPYVPSAFVPVARKRRLIAQEVDHISSEWHWPPSHCVSSFKIDDAILLKLKAPGVGNHGGMNSAEFRAMGDTLWAALCESSSISSTGPVQWLGLSRRPSGLKTSTLDSSIGRRIGLHLDSWDRTPIQLRHISRIRLCINLGTGWRSLLFFPWDIQAVNDALSEMPEDLDWQGNLAGRFCNEFREAPVFELNVPPGYAYLAPTENMIHDGCSMPSSEPDLTIAWLGFISYSASFSSRNGRDSGL